MTDTKGDDWLEIRPRPDGSFDEILAKFADGKVFIETMDDNSVYIGFYKGEGQDTVGLQLWIGSTGKLTYDHAEL